MFRIGFRSLLERLMLAGFAVIAVLMAGSACDKVENKSEIKIEVNTGSVDYLGTVYLTWGGMNVSDCKLNGNSVEPNGSLIIENLKRDTSFTITGKGLSSELLSSKADVKVGARTKYYDFLDTLCSGRWVCIQARELGIPIFGNKPNQWYITNRDVIGDWSNYVSFSGNSSCYIFTKDEYYRKITYSDYDAYYRVAGPFEFKITTDVKSLRFYGDPLGPGEDLSWDIISFSKDSLVLYKRNHSTSWAGSDGSGSGNFPTYLKYVHFDKFEKAIDSNDTTSNEYKILTSSSWRLESKKMYTDGKYDYDDVLSDLQKSMKYFFGKDGTYTSYDGDTRREGPHNWYLIDNNTKIYHAGFTPSGVQEIITIDSKKLILRRTIRFANTDPNGIWHFRSEESHYVR